MKRLRAFTTFAVTLVLFMAPTAVGAEHRISRETDVEKLAKTVSAGDSLILENGIWPNADLKFERLPGTAAGPIHIRAESPGKVVFTGETEFRVSGTYVTVSGFVFRNVDGVSDVLQLRTHSQRLAHNCRVTDCVFEQTPDVDVKKESRWISVYGTKNRIDHCYTVGKRNRGTVLVVWVTDQPQRHRIDHNYFGPRPELGRNGGETIRIGTSETSEFDSSTLVEENYFQRCNGESEIISSKSCDNTFRRNVFDECAGALTLRHGHRCLVASNLFLGKKQRGTGGVRIIGTGHRVINNYFEGLRGDAERAAVSMMNGVPNSPLNEYSPVRSATVSHNTFVDCKVSIELGVGAGKKQSEDPKDCRFTHNAFLPGKWPIFRVHSKPIDFAWIDNMHQAGRDHEDHLVTFERTDLEFSVGSDGLLRPSSAKAIRAKSMSSVKKDFDGFVRKSKNLCGCDDPTTQSGSWPSLTTTGPTWQQRD